MYATPDIVYGPLFEAVQLSAIFPDSKTFVDLVPTDAPELIVQAYLEQRQQDGFDLSQFLDHYFVPEERPIPPAISTTDLDSHIDNLWSMLQRKPDATLREGSTKIALPHAYIVPGGRFNEIYYWDSYFTMVGLVRARKIDLALGMLKNFTFLIEEYGHIPNGNRTYFLSRSQPPFYSLMYQLMADHLSEAERRQCYQAMIKEYNFWMDGANQLSISNPQNGRVVKVGDHIVNRYYDDSPTPRQESYKEDVEDAEGLSDKPKFYRHIRAACESGWDFSSRWFADPADIRTIRTLDIIPVDLNCLLWNLERVLADLSTTTEKRKHFRNLADERVAAIQSLCWSEKMLCYTDYLYPQNDTTDQLTAAAVFPLYFGLATEQQAASVASVLEEQLIKSGGLMTTTAHTTQQWDAPNGWAPLQYVAIYGLDRYKHLTLAKAVARGWCRSCEEKYAQDHKLIEKYNVINPLHTAKGGEYPAQDGFGWTNAVYIDCKFYLES